MAEDIEFTLSVDTSAFDRGMKRLIDHPLWTELAARLEEKRRRQNERAVAWWRSQRPEVAYRNLGELAGRRNGKRTWAGRSREDIAATGTPNQSMEVEK